MDKSRSKNKRVQFKSSYVILGYTNFPYSHIELLGVYKTTKSGLTTICKNLKAKHNLVKLLVLQGNIMMNLDIQSEMNHYLTSKRELQSYPFTNSPRYNLSLTFERGTMV